ncbi:hypothetical protein PV10_07303 [Exophiala mesophila]|uniref:Uncharacterized protein n=1 Tax=Exophiala mesophila TaxID=212818 RepID=A0A0D1Z7M9_EXOME|nr:uncharacterized protein PV10_07303 [Exophiala mesophila]KIV89949.1 hypothetical protein PV10_07303 [Exophiala mesophila]
MDDEERIQSSPTPTPQKADFTANEGESSPLPSHTRHDSISRKRTNDDVYKPVETPKSSPRSARFHLTRSQPGSPTILGSQNTTTASGQKPSPSKMSGIPRTEFGKELSTSGRIHGSFAQEIKDYEKRLEQEFHDFERSLNDRDSTADLEPLDWNELEARYKKEIKPHLDTEQEIMTEFSARFQVGIHLYRFHLLSLTSEQQFMLYMQVSNEQETDRAIKRLRTRMALAQNSEQSLVKKQDHRGTLQLYVAETIY